MERQYKGTASLVSDVLIVKDIDAKEGIVTGYASVFGNIDADGDMLMPGAFTKTIQDNGPQGKNRVMHLWQHNPLEPIGKPHVLKEDAIGLYFETKLAQTTRGADTLKLYEAGIINEHSIGFNTVKKEQKGDHIAILETKLWEFSSVTWGANALTRTTGLKAEGGDKWQPVFEYRQKLYKAIQTGTYTDNTFLLLIDQLEALDNELKTLLQDITTQPEQQPQVDVKATTEPEVKNDETLQFIHLIKHKF